METLDGKKSTAQVCWASHGRRWRIQRVCSPRGIIDRTNALNFLLSATVYEKRGSIQQSGWGRVAPVPYECRCILCLGHIRYHGPIARAETVAVVVSFLPRPFFPSAVVVPRRSSSSTVPYIPTPSKETFDKCCIPCPMNNAMADSYGANEAHLSVNKKGMVFQR